MELLGDGGYIMQKKRHHIFDGLFRIKLYGCRIGFGVFPAPHQQGSSIVGIPICSIPEVGV